jgi:hypothetical protein
MASRASSHVLRWLRTRSGGELPTPRLVVRDGAERAPKAAAGLAQVVPDPGHRPGGSGRATVLEPNNTRLS